MKGTFRQAMSWLHTWAGLVLSWVLYFIFLTGTAGYFDTEIDRWMQPEVPIADNTLTQSQRVELAGQRLKQVAPDAQLWLIRLPAGRQPFLSIEWEQADKSSGKEILHPQTGVPIMARETGGGQLLYRMHYRLHYMPRIVAYWLTSLCAMFMLLALITGIVIHKKIFKDFFTFRPGKQQRSWLDMHNVFSVLALPFHLMITYSGLLFLASSTLPLVISATYGASADDRQRFFDAIYQRYPAREAAGFAASMAPLSGLISDAQQHWGKNQVQFIRIAHPGDANAYATLFSKTSTSTVRRQQLTYDGVTAKLLQASSTQRSAPKQFYDIMINLHEGLFAGPALRWLYFLAGLLGTAMIATGLILWSVKRRNKGQQHSALIFVERLNIGTIAGLPIGIGVYFWANRVLPFHVNNRGDYETLALFIAWALALLYPTFRCSTRQAWLELLSLAAALFTLLPLLNLVTTDRHLGVSLLNRDWVMAGFDGTMLATGALFATFAWLIHNKMKPLPIKTAPVSRDTLEPVI